MNEEVCCLYCLFGQEEDGPVICAIDGTVKDDGAKCKHWASAEGGRRHDPGGGTDRGL